MKKNKFTQAVLRNKYSLLAFVASVFIMLVVYYCFDVKPFGDYTVLRMDLYHQYGPLFAEFYDRITSGESLLYSWNSGLGSSFLGNFSNYLASPLAIIMLIAGHENMPEAIAAMVLIKAAFASAFFSYYLRKSTDTDGFSISAFGVLYSFCGFFIAYYWNIMWIDAMALLPLVILGIEQIIKFGKFKLYLFSMAVVMLSNYYMAYIIAVFSVIYFLVFYFSRYSFNEKFKVTNYVDEEGKFIGTKKEKKCKLSNSRFFNAGIRFAGASIAAAGIAAILLLPLVFILKNSSATSGTFPTEASIYFKIFDFIANHLNSVDPTIRSSGEDVLPNVYCGLITAMLAPLYLYSKHYSKKEKVCYVFLLGLLFVSFNLNILNYIWHGFHYPNDLPYRLSYIYSFILLVMAFKALKHIKDYSPKMLLSTGVASLIFVILIQELGSKNVSEDTVLISIIFIVIYTLVMILMNSGKYQASAIALLLFCCVVSEAAIGNTSHYVMQQQKSYYVDDYDKFVSMKNVLDKRENNEFYRMELTDLRTRMDPSWYDYNGVSIFSSMAYESTSNLLNYLGIDGNFINSYTYSGFQTPVFNMMTSLKYVVDNTTTTPAPYSELFTEVTQISKFKAYENNYCLNIGYCVDNSILGWDYSNNNPFVVQNDYFERSTGVANVFTPVPVQYASYQNIDDFTSGFDNGQFTFFRTVSGSDASFTLCYEITETKDYYIFIESSNIEEVSISYNDVVYDHNFDSEHIVHIGYIEAGTTVFVDIPITSDDSGYVDVYLNGLDLQKFKQGYNILKSSELQIESFTDTKINGTVTAQEDCVFYTSIPYDDSWQIYVDGERVYAEDLPAGKDDESDEKFKFDEFLEKIKLDTVLSKLKFKNEDEVTSDKYRIGNGFLGFKLSEGTHKIELKYQPKGIVAGAAISCITIVALVLVLFVFHKKRPFECILKGYSDKADITLIVKESDAENSDEADSENRKQ
ncbi:MAG: YfhO family protein [Clostridia bacterium]|nr:YfhO family protein [Clostridia bacterium]